MTSRSKARSAPHCRAQRAPSKFGQLVLLALLALAGRQPANADQVPGPPLYDGPLLLLTPASQGENSLPEDQIRQIAPATRMVVSAHGFHALLSKTRSECFVSGCTAVFVAQRKGATSISRPMQIDGATTVLFANDADDTNECHRNLALREGIRVSVRIPQNGVAGWLGTAVRCSGRNPDFSDYNVNRISHVEITVHKRVGAGLPLILGDEVSYQVNGQAFRVNRAEIERRLLREDGR